MFTDMNINKQRFAVFMNRWCGNFWQRNGLKVIPAVGWGSKESFEFCFSGIQENSIVAISTLGTFKDNKQSFLNGYFELQKQKNPKTILCYGKLHEEMKNNKKIIQCLHEGEISKAEARFERDKKLYQNYLFPLEENNEL